MKVSSWALVGITLAICVGLPANAAVLKTSALKDGRIVISVTGDIAEGDTDAFKAIVKAPMTLASLLVLFD
jgi:hypothetical protein